MSRNIFQTPSNRKITNDYLDEDIKIITPSKENLIKSLSYKRSTENNILVINKQFKHIKTEEIEENNENNENNEYDIYQTILTSKALLPNEDIVKMNRMKYILNLKKQLNSPEDQLMTEFLYNKIRVDEIATSLLSITSILLSVMYYQITYEMKYKISNEISINQENRELSEDIMLWFISIINLVYCKLYLNTYIVICYNSNHTIF